MTFCCTCGVSASCPVPSGHMKQPPLYNMGVSSGPLGGGSK